MKLPSAGLYMLAHKLKPMYIPKNSKQVAPETGSNIWPTGKLEQIENLTSRQPQYSSGEAATGSRGPLVFKRLIQPRVILTGSERVT